MNKFVLKRKIFPVGQGAFYCESFETGENIVYDCGNANQIEILKDCIDKEFCKNKTIEAIFISHLHYDHISGLEYLLTNCDVKYIYIPFLTPEGLALIKLYYKYKKYKNNFVQNFLDNPKNAIDNLYTNKITFKDKEKPKIIFIREKEEKNNNGYLDDINSWNERMCDKLIESGTNVANDLLDKKNFWLYIPFNICNNFYLTKIKKAFAGAFGSNWHNNILKSANWKASHKKNKSKIVNIFNKVLSRKDFNIYSLTLLSVPYGICGILQAPCNLFLKSKYSTGLYRSCCFDGFCDVNCNYNCIKYDIAYKPPGCLYTGDYDCSSNWSLLHCAYKEYWDRIGCFQIPHHGSIYSFNDKIIKMNSFFFLSAGKKNKYNHPNSNVIYKIYCSGRFFQWVSEEPNSQICFICF